MVADDDVSLSNDDGDDQPDSSATTTNDQVTINNQNGTFQFDIEVEQAGNDGVYTPVFEVEAQADTTADPAGKSVASQSPTVQNPVVNVYGQNGGELPVSESSNNQILANDLSNQLRVEAFPADEDGFVLPDGLAFGLAGTFAEDNVGTSTQNINDAQTSQLATDGFEEGQIGFFQATPTGTGVGFANLQFGGAIVRDTSGNPVRFDVLSTNRQIGLSVSPSNPTASNNVTITATDQSTFDTVDAVSVTVESPQGDAITVLTDDQGEAVHPASFLDEAGSYTVNTRRAGYADATASFTVDDVPQAVALARFDTDDDNTIDRSEAVSAIVAYNTGGTVGGEEVTRSQAVDVIVAYNSGQTVAA